MKWKHAITYNWPLKLLALALSFSLWVLYTGEPLAEAGYTVPIVFRNLPEGLDVSGTDLTQASVVLRGRAGLLRRLRTEDLAVQVILEGRPEGEAAIPLAAANLEAPLGAEVVRITPAELRVRLVRRAP
jgi:hypothetical protein